MKRTLWWVVFALAALTINGCDEPNEPDLPRKAYHLDRVIGLEGLPEDVCARGRWVAVANGTFGAAVFDVSDGAHPVRIFDYVASIYSQCTNVTLDTVHRYLAAWTDPSDVYNYQIFAFVPGDSQPHLRLDGLGTPMGGFTCRAVHSAAGDTMSFWFTDLSPTDWRMASIVRTRLSDTSAWEVMTSPCPEFRGPHGKPHGLDIRADGMLALANEDAGLVVYNTFTCHMSDTIDTPGIAYACAWAGDYVVVADEYRVTIVDASNPDDITLAASLDIAGASRLRKVAVDGRYAALADEYDGIYVVDISNPHTPQYVQLLSLEDPTGVAALNGRIYATDQSLGLVIYSR